MEATDRLLEEAELDVAYLRQAVVRQRGVSEAVNGERANHCDACFSGEYPLPDTEAGQAKDAFELPLLTTQA